MGDCLAALEHIPDQSGEAYRYALDIAALQPCASAAIVGALADHQARVRGVPLALQMAASQGLRPSPRLRCNALLSSGDVEQALSAQAQGFGGIKWKSSGDPMADAQAVQAIRKAVGPSVRLRLDANGSWTTAQALEFAQRVQECDLDYVEQPLAVGEEDALALLTEAKLRVGLDESAASIADIKAACERMWAEVLVIKAQWLGGYPACARPCNWPRRGTPAGLSSPVRLIQRLAERTPCMPPPPLASTAKSTVWPPANCSATMSATMGSWVVAGSCPSSLVLALIQYYERDHPA